MHPEFHVRQTEKRFKTYVKIKYPSTLWQMLGAGDGDTRSNIAAKLNLTEHASSFVNPNNERSASCCSSKIPRFVYRNSFFKRLTKQNDLSPKRKSNIQALYGIYAETMMATVQ